MPGEGSRILRMGGGVSSPSPSPSPSSSTFQTSFYSVWSSNMEEHFNITVSICLYRPPAIHGLLCIYGFPAPETSTLPLHLSFFTRHALLRAGPPSSIVSIPVRLIHKSTAEKMQMEKCILATRPCGYEKRLNQPVNRLNQPALRKEVHPAKRGYLPKHRQAL